MNLGDAADAYLSERRRNRSLAPKSVVQVQHLLWRFTQYFGADRDPATIKLADVSEWLASTGVGPRTMRCYASQARGLFSWLLMREEIDRDPFFGVQLPRNPDSEPRSFEPETVTLCLDECADSRELLIVSLKVQEGLRACEVAGLELAHVARSRGAVFVRGGKGNKDRTVPLTDETRRALTDYLAEHPPRSAGPLIRSYVNPNRGISAGRVSHMMTALMYRTGIKQRSRDGVSGHCFRHTAAQGVLMASGDPMVVQKFLGHASISTAMGYVRAATDESLRAAVNGRTYRSAS